jgi:hypothetical protein
VDFPNYPTYGEVAWSLQVRARVVLSDVLGSKDVVEGRDGRTDERTRRIVIGRIRVKTELHA